LLRPLNFWTEGMSNIRILGGSNAIVEAVLGGVFAE
jgi:hypothetical protein